MKTQALAAAAALGVWLAGTTGAQGGASEKFLALAGSDTPQSVETTRAETVDRATVSALRQLAIEAGQTSSSGAKKPERSAAALDAERAAIERHRVAFFQRAYGTTTAVAELGGLGPGRHPPTLTQYAELPRYGADRHPPISTRFAGLTGPGADRHPPTVTRFADLTRPGADRHPLAATRFAELTQPGLDRHPPIATRFARLAPQEPIEVVLQVGTAADHFAMAPKTLKLKKGELYKLVIVNRSRVTHQVSAPEFGAAIDSASLTGGIELKPGDRAVWYFTADQEGTYGIACSQMEHAKAGMVGKIIVSEAMG